MYGKNQGAEKRENFNPSKGTVICKSWDGIPVQRQVCEERERQRDDDEDGGGAGKEWDGLFRSSPQDQNHVRNKPLVIYVREL